jgi:hypothetical protein
LDSVFETNKTGIRPVFHLLGGTALLFHGIVSISTIDIDTANRLTDRVRDLVEPFISDNASEVATLAKHYTSRLIPYKPEVFRNMDVYLLSLEDLVITKLGAGRFKDIEDLTKTDIMRRCDFDKLSKIIMEEFDTSTTSKLLIRLSKLD